MSRNSANRGPSSTAHADIVSRFAPAPTGYLHLGHIVNAVYVWGVTRALGGRVLLRIEDHDRHRSRLEYESAILEDLEWLGFAADAPPVRQSDRGAIYENTLAGLRGRGLVYACECSRTAVARADRAMPDPNGEVRYPGTCAGKCLPERPGHGIRVRLEPGPESFDDWRRGWQEQRPLEQCGDLLVRDRDGNWTYQFAAAVDDLRQGITLVVRGDDLLPSTGRQVQLARLLGRRVAASFLHHPLIMKSPSQKLSKSDGDTGIRDLRAAGWCAEQVIGRAAALAGLVDVVRPVAAHEAAALVRGIVSRGSTRVRT